jgi:hypothetical protein
VSMALCGVREVSEIGPHTLFQRASNRPATTHARESFERAIPEMI